jgi:hypothetical protein
MTVERLIAELTALGPGYKDHPVTFDIPSDFDSFRLEVVDLTISTKEVILGS